MGVTSEASFEKKELAEMRGESPRQKAERVVGRGSDLLGPGASVALALLFAFAHADLGQILGALLIVNLSRVLSTVGKFAPKR